MQPVEGNISVTVVSAQCIEIRAVYLYSDFLDDPIHFQLGVELDLDKQ